jgi:hypothetical protein
MSTTAPLPGLLGQLSHWQRLGDGFRSSTNPWQMSELAPYLAGLGLAALVGLLVHFWRQHNDMSLRCDNPRKLFRELCQAHGLDAQQRRLLLEVAEAACPYQPALVFLQPQSFAAERLPPALAERAAELTSLRERLFA